MTTEQHLERDLPTILGDLAIAPYPDYIDDVLATTAQRRQRPAWTFPERWLPMDITTHSVAAPRIPWRGIGLIAVAGLVMAALVAVIVGSQRQPPPPFGPAANGRVTFVDSQGSIVLGDVGTGEVTVLVPGPGLSRPVFSPAGTDIAFVRQDGDGRMHVVIVDVATAAELVVSAEGRREIGHLGWTPDGASVVVSTFGRLYFLDAAGGGETRLLDTALEPVTVFGNDSFNADLSDLFRPPDGTAILYIARDGSNHDLRLHDRATGTTTTLLAQQTAPVNYNEITSAQWSPDGSMIAMTLFDIEHGDYIVYVMDADGSDLRRLVETDSRAGRSEAHPAWSPDGTRIALMRWYLGEDTPDARPITVVHVERGDQVEMDIASPNGYVGFSWSPDGANLVFVPDADRDIVIVDAATGAIAHEQEWFTDEPVTWQRKAP